MDQEGIDAVKANMNNAFVALCPLSNIYIHNALPPIGLMRKNGLKLTVGTDSLSSNEELNIVKELYCLQENFPVVALGEMLTWACLNGAEFLGKMDVLGSIQPEKKPGLVLIDHLGANATLTSASASYRIV
jgi:cytosine/adenosine deaminase-related metal-dependent hydrolase